MKTKTYPTTITMRATDRTWEDIAAIKRLLEATGFDADTSTAVRLALHKYRLLLEREAAAITSEGL